MASLQTNLYGLEGLDVSELKRFEAKSSRSLARNAELIVDRMQFDANYSDLCAEWMMLNVQLFSVPLLGLITMSINGVLNACEAIFSHR